MKTLLVGYDLRGPESEYEPLLEALRRQPGWWHHLDSTWLVRTYRSAVELRDELKAHMRTQDELLVMEVTGSTAAWVGFDSRAGDWIKQHV